MRTIGVKPSIQNPYQLQTWEIWLKFWKPFIFELQQFNKKFSLQQHKHLIILPMIWQSPRAQGTFNFYHPSTTLDYLAPQAIHKNFERLPSNFNSFMSCQYIPPAPTSAPFILIWSQVWCQIVCRKCSFLFQLPQFTWKLQFSPIFFHDDRLDMYSRILNRSNDDPSVWNHFQTFYGKTSLTC